MRILVCGGRDYNDAEAVNEALDAVHRKRGITLIIEGGATGADTLARQWAKQNGVQFETEKVTKEEWRRYGRAAGPMRNTRMLKKWDPEGVVAFPGGTGTADMIRQAQAAGIKVWRPYG